jgi:putative ABC transport system ATP-binding protein
VAPEGDSHETPILEIRDLAKRFHVGDGEPIRAVDGLSLTVSAGEFIALYGPSGSGKSTLLDLIAGFQAPDRGTVRVDGRDMDTLSEGEHADCLLHVLGIIGQADDLLPGATAQENASLKLWRTDMRSAASRIAPLMMRLGLGTRMTHPTRKLSMGERQRVLIAQALAQDPKLVLADEPTGNLDSPRSREVLELLQTLCHERRMALVLATHDLQAASYADRAYELCDGRLRDYAPAEGSRGTSKATARLMR